MVTREYGSCECMQTREYTARKYLRVASETLHLSGAVRSIFLDNGISTREHENTGSHPKHAFTFRMILEILQFIQDYAEQHAILLLGHSLFTRRNIKLLSLSDTKKIFLK